MRRFVLVAISLMVMNGCGSCAEDKKVPETEQTGPSIKVITRTDETGAKKRPVQVGDNTSFADAIKQREAGAAANPP